MSADKKNYDAPMSDTRKTPVVLLHSAFFNAVQFEPLQRMLSGYSTYAPTYRGQNGIPKGDRPITMETLAEDLVRDLRDRFAEPVHLIGNAMGAYVAVHASAQAPEMVRSLALMAASAAPEPDPTRLSLMESEVRGRGPAHIASSIANFVFGQTYLAENPDEVRRWTQVFARVDASIADTIRAIYARTDMRPLIERIAAPMLLLAGDEDRARKPEELAQIAIDKPGSIFCTVKGAGHTVALEQPAAVARLMVWWWELLDSSCP